MVAGMYANNETCKRTVLNSSRVSKQNTFITPSWCTDNQKQKVEELATDMLLVNSSSTPISTLDILAEVASPVLLERIAENPNTSPYTLSKLAFHDNPRVRAAVTENPNLPESIMWRLASDIHPDVRLRLAESYFVPPSILKTLAQDDNPYVQSRAQRTIGRLTQPMGASLSFDCC